MAQSPVSAEVAFQLVTKDLQCPAVFKNMIESWQCRQWNFKEWEEKLGDRKVKFRIGPRHNSGDPLWESQCFFLYASLKEFNLWLSFGMDVPSGNAFEGVNPIEMWCYADYKYMAELFKGDDELLKMIDWNLFGFEGRNGKDSTLWMGSKGSHTPCHYDTYGFNLVAQLQGRKRWILFSPDQTEMLYPTRIPYEESSVFSEVNITSPDLETYPKFKLSTPHIVVLNPGDVLFVPHNWWHFVESLEPTITVNTWVEMVSDNVRRIEEAVTRIVVTSLANEFSLVNWLNPTEEPPTKDSNFQYLKASLWKSLKEVSSDTDNKTNNCKTVAEKRKFPSFNAGDETFCSALSCSIKKQRLSAKESYSNIQLSSVDNQQRSLAKCCSDERLKSVMSNSELIEFVKPITFDDFLNQARTKENICDHKAVGQDIPSYCFLCGKNYTAKSEGDCDNRRETSSLDSKASGVTWDDTISSRDSLPDCTHDAVNINRTVADKGISKEECEECETSKESISVNEQWDPDCSEISDRKLHYLLINCLAHPRTVSVISHLLQQNIHTALSK